MILPGFLMPSISTIHIKSTFYGTKTAFSDPLFGMFNIVQMYLLKRNVVRYNIVVKHLYISKVFDTQSCFE